jgi:hypothetical protein
MIQPMIVDMKATNNTAAAPRSLIILISGLMSMEIRSHIYSIAVLKISAVMTKQTHNKINSHSDVSSLKINPPPTTINEVTM